MSIDNLLDRTWSRDYTCNEFACEAWKQITGKDLSKRIYKALSGKGRFKRLEEPISPCIVYFKNSDTSPTHVGLFYCDKLLHLTSRGVQFVPLEVVAMHFREVSFYT
ncbi:hypothetical protein B9T31_17600 [Acinetobacter sp. ANC 4558]|uniref:hypothetical protein n=1 Tax=Acinetobacter sp. ANC 4558 TaxID=1977876 RepID=UPI000A34C3DA|nr:hypothetical protein [Acinetobacter sp. ANC 4558]OTG78415.1 hypothetical protein B9T31_17600 [Acinetobacter sp. ANC 4558]